MLARSLTAFALASLLALPRSTLAAAPTAEPIPTVATTVVRAKLDVEVAGGDAGAALAERIRVRGEALLRDHEVLPARSPGDPRILIAIESLGESPGYRCRFGAWRGEAVVAGTDGVSLCELCTEAELVEHVGAAIVRVVEQLPPQTQPPPPRPLDEPVAGREQGRAPLGKLGKAGVGLLAGGAVIGLAVGVPLLALRPKITSDGQERVERVGTKPIGIAMVAVGGALLVTGAVLLALDRSRARKSTRRAVLGPGGVVLRF
ncbi:MAG: hypothetical protein IPH07_08230 [Deltaproteobacteria bacterium]|nr:hypothetical protein [Deltaproteobacteria bacterium]MBK8720020.1 hypothetical protein [Deltaproteobacteria bacterium]